MPKVDIADIPLGIPLGATTNYTRKNGEPY